MLLEEIATLDEVLEAHSADLGKDFTPYRNHAYRVANFCAALVSGDPQSLDKTALEKTALQKIGLAAAFHDLGIWTDGTFDYLEPSIERARDHLARSGREEWAEEITAMIRQHHKISAYRAEPGGLVEPFRRADWVDVTWGLRRFGLPRKLVKQVQTTWPSAGFHQRLVQFELGHLRTHPFNPLPMMKL